MTITDEHLAEWREACDRDDDDELPSVACENFSAILAEVTALRAKLAMAEKALVRIEDWTLQYGAALCPNGSSDTFGDGMRAAKKQVAALAAIRGG